MKSPAQKEQSSLFPKITSCIYQQFPAFKHKNYRLYFTGQLASFTGSWLQGVAYGWLVYSLTQSAFWLGAVSALSTLPILFLSLLSGFLVDKFDRKKVLILTQTASLLLAFILGVLTISNLINLPILLLIAFLTGVINSLDGPATQAFVVNIVSKEDLPSAVGLNSTMFNTGRILGPAVAGFLIALIGVGNVFLINGASFLAILTSLYFIKANIETRKSSYRPLQTIRQGVAYAFNHPLISLLLYTAGVGAIFCFSQATIMPVFAEKVFAGGATGLGYLLSATGLGALTGSLLISSKIKKIKSSKIILAGNVLFILSTFLFSLTKDIYLASFFLFFSGLGLTIQFSTIYASIQKLVHEEFRGRVLSIYILMFIGLSLFGNLLLGSTSSLFGPQAAIQIATTAVIAYSIWIYIFSYSSFTSL